MQTYHVAIVGGGPRGLGVLERLVALYSDRKPAWGLHVHLIDPAEPGEGTHSSRQPEHLLTNTVAGQITLFTDPSVRDAGPIRPGPSLLDWARSMGYRRVDGRFVQSGTGEDMHEDDYVPRALLGKYLKYVYLQLINALPHNLQVTHQRSMAEDVSPLADGRHRVKLAGKGHLIADCVVLAIGHSDNRTSAPDRLLQRRVRSAERKNPNLLFLKGVNPFGALRSISPAAKVCVQGMGLTAYDVISELTEGRGGRFERIAGGGFRYERSGKEPHMLLCSRQGVPFSARGVNQKGIGGLHRPLFFTRQWIDDVRRRKEAATGSGKLDYGIDLWPTLKKEMCFVYDTTRSGAQAVDAANYAPSAESERAITYLFSPLGAGHFPNEAAYRDAVRRYTEDDLNHAIGGNVRDPLKAATDVLRDVRDYLRYAVDYGGLTEESHRRFLDEAIPVMYRISAGAPKERNMQLLALIDAGVAAFGPGPSPEVILDETHGRFVLRSTRLESPVERHADVLIHARIDTTVYPERQDQALIRNMLRAGTLRPFMNGSFHPGGIDVDASQRVVDARGRIHASLWALGIVVEGANFCTYVLPRALVNSRFIQFSGRCALAMFAHWDACNVTQPQEVSEPLCERHDADAMAYQDATRPLQQRLRRKDLTNAAKLNMPGGVATGTAFHQQNPGTDLREEA